MTATVKKEKPELGNVTWILENGHSLKRLKQPMK
jgi:hypothetical protein